MLIFAMPLMIWLVLNCSTKISENLTWKSPEQLFASQELIKVIN
jgi:hypothetical protein